MTDKKLIIALDLEMNQPSGKIIQIGAVVGDLTSGEILGSLSVLVDHQEAIDPRIAILTGITDERIATERLAAGGSRSLKNAHDALISFKNRPEWGGIDVPPLTWGGNDIEILRSQVFGRQGGSDGSAKAVREGSVDAEDDADGGGDGDDGGDGRPAADDGATAGKTGSMTGTGFGYRFIDVKTLFQSWSIATGRPHRAGLRNAMRRVGLTFEGR